MRICSNQRGLDLLFGDLVFLEGGSQWRMIEVSVSVIIRVRLIALW